MTARVNLEDAFQKADEFVARLGDITIRSLADNMYDQKNEFIRLVRVVVYDNKGKKK